MLKVWREVENTTPSMDALLVEEHFDFDRFICFYLPVSLLAIRLPSFNKLELNWVENIPAKKLFSHVRITASETEALVLPVSEFGTAFHVACKHLTSATNILNTLTYFGVECQGVPIKRMFIHQTVIRLLFLHLNFLPSYLIIITGYIGSRLEG